MHSQDSKSAGLSYRDAGVNIDAGNELIEQIKPHAKRTRRPEVLGGLGGFGALFEIPLDRYKNPVLVAGTDGVGTKLKLAVMMQRHDTIGIDLVAMCVNDLIVQGAEPLFFLDYYATGKLSVGEATDVVKGIADGCNLSGCALIGGETAEMPGIYRPGDYDLAGFCVGVVDKTQIIDGAKVTAGDILIGLPSSGCHSNGYSLIRKIVERSGAGLNDDLAGRPLGEQLLMPTRIYVRPLLKLFAQVDLHALAHITGGGLSENLPRVLPEGSRAIINSKSWGRPVVFDWLQAQGNIEDSEMYRTFNCGIGMVLVVGAADSDKTLELLRAEGEAPVVIGKIESGSAPTEVIIR